LKTKIKDLQKKKKKNERNQSEYHMNQSKKSGYFL